MSSTILDPDNNIVQIIKVAATRYPCPAYKNPSDYYLDLVTLDDLSPEAMLESSQRVEQLSSIYQVLKIIIPLALVN